jgi:DNA mismatch repair protein MutL
VEYGAQVWFPNAEHPVFALFLTIDPALADFNVHPAKREARFRDSGAIHHAVSETVAKFTHFYSSQGAGLSGQRSAGSGQLEIGNEQLAMSNEQRTMNDEHQMLNVGQYYINNIERMMLDDGGIIAAEPPPPAYSANGLRYVGRLFNLFIVVEFGDTCYIIDQHAAHERLLYNKFFETSPERQDLLIPIVFATDSADEDEWLESRLEDLASLGFVLEREGSGANLRWKITSLPAEWKLDDSSTVRELRGLRDTGTAFIQHAIALAACHSAVRDGDYLDAASALELARSALDLSLRRCPHGRPIMTELSREFLFKAVKRA